MAVSSIFVAVRMGIVDDERDERRSHTGGLVSRHEVTVSAAFQIPMVSER
jgi:hypothetical protein